MKIALLAPNSKTFPPEKYSPVESIIWETKKQLTKKRHKVTILQFEDPVDLIEKLSNQRFDFIHIHYDKLFVIIPPILNIHPHTKIAISSHFPYMADPEMRERFGRDNYFNWVIRNREVYNFSTTSKDLSFILGQGALASHQKLMRIGVPQEEILFTEEPLNKNKSICVGRIEQSRRQYLTQHISDVDIVGPILDDVGFDRSKNYLGSWSREQTYDNLTEYGNMVLLSQKENGTPDSVKEGFMAGLGLVCTEAVAMDLGCCLPFVDIIPNDKITDLKYINRVVRENRLISLSLRNNIRSYGIEKFSWDSLINDYVQNIKQITKE